MEKVVSTFEFLPGNKHWSGAVEVLEVTDDTGNKHVYMRMRVGRETIRLPRAGLDAVIDALISAKTDAKARYVKLIKEMNRGN